MPGAVPLEGHKIFVLAKMRRPNGRSNFGLHDQPCTIMHMDIAPIPPEQHELATGEVPGALVDLSGLTVREALSLPMDRNSPLAHAFGRLIAEATVAESDRFAKFDSSV